MFPETEPWKDFSEQNNTNHSRVAISRTANGAILPYFLKPHIEVN